MTIIKCVECKAQVSTTAAACPHCGAVAFAPPPKPAPATPADPEQYATAAKVLLGVIMLALVALPVKCAIDAPKRRAAAEAREAKREAADAAFEKWKKFGDGSRVIERLRDDPAVLDVGFTSESSLWVYMLDNGSSRDRDAVSACAIIREMRIGGFFVIHIGDHTALRAGGMRELGSYTCSR